MAIGDEEEYVYFVSEEPQAGFIKIGKTSCVEKRLSSMQTGNPRKLKVILKFYRPKKYDYEKIFHKLFFDKHVRGEWYSLDVNTLIRIEIIMRQNNVHAELSSLFTEFMHYDSNWMIEDDKLFINSPPRAVNRCGSELHGIVPDVKIKKPIKTPKANEIIRKIIHADAPMIAKSLDISHDEFSKMLIKKKMTITERSIVNKYILRAEYGYSGIINEEWVKKYSDKKILLMNKHISSRDMNINDLAASSELLIENMSDIERITKHRTDFMYNVARVKIRDMYDKYNKTIDLPSKLMEYVNQQIEINNPIFGNKKLNAPNTRFVLMVINDVLNILGYEIRVIRLHKKASDNKNIYEFGWFDIASDYYNLLENKEKDNEKPDFPKMKPPDGYKYAELS